MFFSFKKTILFFLIFVSAIYSQEKVKLSLEYAEKKLPFGLTEKAPVNYPYITLALSGGGSRGIAHLGILKAFEENDIPFNCIFGTSMGSMIGGMYSIGYTIAQIDSIVKHTNWDSFFSLKEINRNELFVDQKITEEKAIFAVRLNGFTPIIPSSINTGQRVANFLNLVTLFAPIHVQSNFSELIYDFKAVATNFQTGEMVLLDKGSLSQALRASSSVSLLLPPIEKDSMLLVDGGLVANIPVKPARQYGADLIIASNTSSPLNLIENLILPWEIADQMVSIPMKILNEQQLKEADVIIEPTIGYLKNTDFSKIQFVIEEGYKTGLQNINLIKTKIKQTYINKSEGPVKYFADLTLDVNPTEYEKEIIQNINTKEFASSKELLFELSRIFRRGYIKSCYIEIIPRENKNILKVVTVENPPVKQIDLNGMTLIEKKKAEQSFANCLERPYNSRNVLKSVISTLSTYRDAGYPFAVVKNVEFDSLSGRLSVYFDEIKVSQLEITGNEKTQSDVISREFVFENGNIKFNAIQKGLMNLRATNIFDEIEVYPHSENGIIKLKIDVKEKLSKVARFGLRIDNEYFTQVSLDLRDENFMGTGAEIGLFLSGGLKARSFLLEHKSNRVFDSYLTYKLKAFYDETDINVYTDDTTAAYNRFAKNKTGEYSQSSYGVSIGLGTQVEKFGNILIETKYQGDEIKNKSGITGNDYKIGILSFRLGLSIDSQNKYPFPTEGFLIKAYYETAQSVLGGDIGYTKLFFDYKSSFSINKYNTFTTRFVIGAADNTLPLSQNFSLGGQNTFLGMREFELRGRQVFLTSLEYRLLLPFTIFFDTYIKARYDLGSMWAIKNQIRFKDLKHGIGVILAFDTPIGPAEFAAGQSFYFKDSFKNNTLVLGEPYFYFSIGYTF